MVWGKLVFSFPNWSNLTTADWPSSTSSGGGWWASSKVGSPSGNSAPPTSPSLLTCWGLWIRAGGWEDVQYHQVLLKKSLPVYGARLGGIPSAGFLLAWDILFRELYPRAGGEDSTGLYSAMCESLDFLILEFWIVVEFLGPFVPVPPS